jgi:hypothetical protein
MAGTAAEGEEEVPDHVRDDHAGGDPGDNCGCLGGLLLLKGAEIDGVYIGNGR